MKLKKPRKKSRKALIKEADTLFSLFIRQRDHWTCRVPGCPSDTVLQCAHIVSRWYKGTRWLPGNAFALCIRHHYKWTRDPLDFDRFVEETIGLAAYDSLKIIARATAKDIDLEAIIANLKRVTDVRPRCA